MRKLFCAGFLVFTAYLAESRSPFPENRFFDDNMCGVANLEMKKPDPPEEFSCPYEEPQASKPADEHWPWLGVVTNTETKDKYIGVVIADDTVVTDIKLHEIVTAGSNTTFSIFSQEKHGMGETLAVSKTEVFSTTVVSSNLQKDRMLFLLLKDKIPKDIFRPICIPPPRYVEKMVKPTSCRGEMLQTITKVELGHYGFMKTEEELSDEHSCSLSLLQSSQCTEHFKKISHENDALKPNNKFKRPITDNTDYYTCHAGAVQAARHCNLDEAAEEAKCSNTKKDQCLGFISSGSNVSDKRQNEAMKQHKKCAEKTSKEYTSCVVKAFEETMKEGSDRPYKGINCLHDFMEMSPCAKNTKTKGLMPLGNDWAFNPCSNLETKLQEWCDKKRMRNCFNNYQVKRAMEKCFAKPENRYFKAGPPFEKYWSLLMLQTLEKFSESIVKESQCHQCSEGPNMCTNQRIDNSHNGRQKFLFWFDSCRNKWFFIGTQSPAPLDNGLPSTCDQPRVYADMEGATQLMREAVADKVKSIDLYPKPVIVVLGPTGVGKSTTGNSLISGNAKNAECFKSGSGTSSKTKVTEWKVGKWLGVGRCFTVVDTPGTDDTSGELQDYENIKELTEFLKTDLKQIDVFLVMFKESSNRFVSSMSKAIGVFESIFGKTFWQNMATEFTFWSFAEANMKERYTKLCTEDFRENSCEDSDLDSGSGFEIPYEDSDTSFDFNSEFYDDQKSLVKSSQEGEESTSNEYNELVCTLMMASEDTKFNEMFFQEQNISSTDFRLLESSLPIGNDEFIRNNCQFSNVWRFTDSMYEKADFVSRRIKKAKWNNEYDTDVEVPYVFIHPVWDVADNRQCERFKRETSELLDIANEMQPFVCSSKCQAPKAFFAGQPLLLDYVDQNGTVFADFDRKSFTLTCTIWNGVSYSALRDEDVTWFRGWQKVDYKAVYRLRQTIERSHDKTASIVKLEMTELKNKDQGLYDCTYPGIKEKETLTYSGASQVTKEDARKGKTELTCKVALDINSIDPEQIDWYFAHEIRGLSHFSTSLRKVTNQFAVSQLYMDFEKDFAQEFEGKFGCKTDEFSNDIDLLINENAKWAKWGAWSSCSRTCQPESGEHGVQGRKRKCILPRNNGTSCADLDGEAEEMEACNVKCCPENGLWSSWSGWSVCKDVNTNQIKTCSKDGEAPGTIRRTRTCFPPSCGGNTCSGTDTEVKNCKPFSESPCPIDGNWGEWGPWSECQEDEYEDYGENKNECAGVEIKKRKCANPEPQYGGHDCPGTPIERKFCKPECAIDCKCGDFTIWGQCDKHCGVCGEKETCQEGMQSRERHCTKEQNGGRTCDAVYGNLIENRTCTIPHCPIDATATPWAEWSPCNPSTGRQNRTRNCIEAKFGGKGCDMPVMEIQSCAVDCQCTGKEWGKWSSCSETCGKGMREKTRVCKAHKNNGRACLDNDASIEFSTKVIEECNNERRCPIIILGEWSKWDDWSDCSVKCGGGAKSRSRTCEFLGKTVRKLEKEPFDEDYDREVPCTGSGVETIGSDGVNQCNVMSCEVSTLFYLMDTTGSFSGVDQNSALSLGINLLNELKEDKVKIPMFRIVTINDPDTEVRNVITGQSLFEEKLNNLYKSKHPGGGDWAEKSLDGILKAINTANHGAVLCLFTDAPSKDLDLEPKITKKLIEKDVHLFIFLTPDYDLSNTQALTSYRVYQKISKRHTYIMSKTEPSTASIIMHKALKSSHKECLTYDGPAKWEDSPNECQFPFVYNGVKYDSCTTVDKTQPWCATIVKKEEGAHVPSNKGGENWWGYCGNCKGTVDSRCQAGGHSILREHWRAIKVGDDISGKLNDDSELSTAWYKFEVPGNGNVLPAFDPGVEPTQSCQIGGNFASIELPSSGKLTQHDEEEKSYRFCFDADCNEFKMIDVFWCPPEEHNNDPFYIYKLRPTNSGRAYCVK